jgi:molecular chaperone DnaK
VDKQSGRSQEVAVTYKGAGILSEEELKKRGTMLRQLRIE